MLDRSRFCVRCCDRGGNDGAVVVCRNSVLPLAGAETASELRSDCGFPFVRHSVVVCVVDEG